MWLPVKRINLLLLGLIVLVLVLWQQWPQANLKLVFCSVGQGDAALIIYRDQQVLIDGGPNNQVLSCLGKHLPVWDRSLELVIASHAEADHITGLIEVAKRYQIKQLAAVNEVNDTAEYRQLAQEISRQGIKIRELVRGDSVMVGPVKLTWLWPERPGKETLAWTGEAQVLGAKTSLNQLSQVIEGSFGDFDWLLTGDIDAKIEQKLITSGTLPEVEVLKVAHHGSKYSSSQAFLEAIKPELAIIEVGKNHFGHPTIETLNRLQQIRAAVKRTDQDGDVVVVSDGRNWWLN
ncbi:hypothetical protein KKH13_03430 [Patescibacteria group bacterium]|nr:hypothetical protein [Patescibacteria group bacterium]